MTEYVIFNNKINLFWSNKIGWVDYFSCTQFTADEKECFNLPIDGTWRKVMRLGEYWD